MSVHIETNVMDGLRANFLGELRLPNDLGYDEARSICASPAVASCGSPAHLLTGAAQ
jgi:hypothetical protein